MMTGGRLIGPAVNLYLKQYGLSFTQIVGSGPKGSVCKGDVLKYVAANNLKPVLQEAGPPSAVAIKAPAGPPGAPLGKGQLTSMPRYRRQGPAAYSEVEISNMRRTIAKRLLQSKSTIPHAYGIAECNVQRLSAVRKRLAAEGMKVSVNDVLIKCVTNALLKVPAVNCVWEGDKLSQKGNVDVAVAVATPNGLITPIVFNAQDRDVMRIGENVRYLAGRAKEGKLQPNEFMGGTFSISNLGMFGIHSFSAIINPPQCAILAVGGNILSLDEMGKPTSHVQLTLSYDARAISEQDSAKFLGNLKHEIENLSELSLGIFNMGFKKEMLELDKVLNSM